MIRICFSAATLALLLGLAATARAEPGLGNKVYGAHVEKGVTEVESRYGRLDGGSAAGQDGWTLEVEHGFSSRFSAGVLAKFDRPAGGNRRLDALAIESVFTLGRIDALGLDTAIYAEYEAVQGGKDVLETKLLLQHVKGPFDARFNLIVEKELGTSNPLEIGYAASADWATPGELRLGVEAFGEAGTTRNFVPRAKHYIGPVAKVEIEHLPGNSELDIQASYLFAAGVARNYSNGQARLLLEWEKHF